MPKQSIKKPIIIDTDPGHDDALAILLLEKSQKFNIRAVTTVAGNSNIQNVTNNARYVLDLINSPTPIFSGSPKPLKRNLIQAVVHGKGGLAGANIEKKEPPSANAVEKIIELIRRSPKKISVLLIGPETNLALAFLKEPSLPKLIKEVVIMGGAIAVPGNKNRVAEFNIFVDPEAAQIVFNAPVKKVVIPLDLCNQIYFTLADFEKIKGTSLYKPLVSMMKQYVFEIESQEKTKGALMYDPLAAYYLVNPKAFTLKPMDIRIETMGELTRGMTVADRRIWGEKRNNIQVATQIDKASFRQDFFQILKR